MDQSDRSIGVEHFSILYSNIPPLILGILGVESLQILAIVVNMDTTFIMAFTMLCVCMVQKSHHYFSSKNQRV